jgi:hypothetical protein
MERGSVARPQNASRDPTTPLWAFLITILDVTIIYR